MRNYRNKSKLGWSSQEEDLIRHLREEKKIKSWKTIQETLAKNFPNSKRTGKQCRQRYTNYIKFEAEQEFKSDWQEKDKKQLFRLFDKHGLKWTDISKQMHGRPENSVKNKFYGLIRKLHRKISRVEAKLKIKQKKPIKHQNIIRLLQASKQMSQLLMSKNLDDQKVEPNVGYIFRCKQLMIDAMINQQEIEKTKEIMQILQLLHQFNSRKKKLLIYRQKQSPEAGHNPLQQNILLNSQSKLKPLDNSDHLSNNNLNTANELSNLMEINEQVGHQKGQFLHQTNKEKNIEELFCQILQIQYKNSDIDSIFSQ